MPDRADQLARRVAQAPPLELDVQGTEGSLAALERRDHRLQGVVAHDDRADLLHQLFGE